MMVSSNPSRIFIFGDQTTAFESDLRSLLHVKDNESLQALFEKANYALRCEIAQLPASQREIFPRFTCVLDLLQHFRESGGNPALGLALLTLNHLGRFIKFFGEESRPYPAAANSYVIGLCTGSFAAAAISTSQTLSELMPAALEAVLIAFRTGLASIEARNDIEHDSATAPIWSVIVGMQDNDAQSAIDNFVGGKPGLPAVSRPYLSAITTNSVTLSGPPSVLRDLLASSFAGIKPLKLSVHAPYHASHIYNSTAVDAILAASDFDILTSYKPRIPLISCSTGERAAVATYGALMRIVLEDVLIKQLRWDLVLGGCSSQFVQTSLQGSQFSLFPILTNAAPTLAAALSQAAGLEVPVNGTGAETSRTSDNLNTSGRKEQSKIAIVGHSGRFPDAASTEKFWDLLHKGLDVHRKIPKDRFDMEAHFDPTGKAKNTSRIQHGCFIEEPGLFDARFFNMSPRESSQADPGQRLAITTAYEAMEMAGFVPDRTPSSQKDRIGIFYGMTSDDWREVNSGQNVDTYFIPGGNRAFTPGRINYHFKFSGPSFSIDTACSSSFAAIHTACNSLWRGDCDTAIAGGTNVMTNPDNFAGLDRGHFLSTTGNCNTFDDNANGYCRADAVGTVILKRLEDAQADKDPIYGVLLGAYTNHSAEADSMTRPHAGAQAFIFNKMLNQANVHPLDVSYIEMHGTGTQTGDAVEMKSVLEVFAKKPRGIEHPLHLGSAKANVGHAESASGVTALIKVLKMMEKNEIPPHCGIKTKINHGFPTDLKARNVNIAMAPTAWTRPKDGKRTVFLNNFSAAGGNTALLMEDAPIRVQHSQDDERSFHIVAVSAKSIGSLESNIRSMVQLIDSTPDLSLPALSYTTTARRMHHNHRLIVTGHDIVEIRSALESLGPCKDVRPIQAAKVPNVAFAFTGQGCLYSGVAKIFFGTMSQFRSDIQRFDLIAQNMGFPSFLPLVDGSKEVSELGPVVSQLGAASVQMALTRLWASWGIVPSAVIGHSLGEYAALNAAGVLSVSDTIYLTGMRAQLLEKLCTVGTHCMLAVKASPASLNKYMSTTTCEIACINGPEASVLSGVVSEIESLSGELTAAGFQCVKLEVPFAFHSAQVEAILEEFEELAQTIVFKKPEVAYISPLLSEVVTEDGILGASYLSRACRETVNFVGGLSAAVDAKVVSDKTIWVEIGPQPVCSGMVKSTIGSQVTTLPTLRKNTDAWKIITSSLGSLHTAGVEVQWNEYHRDFEGSQFVIPLPAYNWDAKNYWIQGNNNNFCLTKGDEAPKAIAAPISAVSQFNTTSVQRIIEENHRPQVSTMVIESDLSDPVLSKSVLGHSVNGVALCPSSLYADIGLTLGEYLLKASSVDDDSIVVDVADMKVGNPLIYTASNDVPQLFRVSVSANWATQTADLSFYSVDTHGKKTVDHAKCTLKFGNRNEWSKDFNRHTYLIKHRIDSLYHGVDNGQSHKIKRSMAYKLFGAVVKYEAAYQGMEEVILDSDMFEATARVKFQATESHGNFNVGPYRIDSLGHIAGFIMNANDNTDPNVQVFVNHGWDRMRCTKAFSNGTTYQTYNRMQNVGGTLYSGDTYILEEGKVIAVFEGVKFQGVPRSVLDHLLPSGAKATRNVPSPKPVSNASLSKSKTQKTAQKATLPSPAAFVAKKPSVADQVLAIVAEEVGLDVKDLVPSSSFSDFGVDSLLSLNIAGRLREELELEVESSLFADCPTVKDLIAFLPGGNNTPSIVDDSSSPSTPELDSLSAATSTTEGTDQSLLDDEVHGDDSSLLATIRLTIAEEIGIPVEELTGSLPFGDVGMDSLLSLTVLGKLREVLDIELDGKLFQDNASLDEVEAALGLKSKSVAVPPPRVNLPAVVEIVKQASHPPATSIVLQGNAKTASKILFLFPDGSGSATSYAPLPKIASDTVVYGLNCPYMKRPQDMKCSLDELTPSYLHEVRRRQPHGPYSFGGWSAGGICAFDAAQQLDREGEKVEHLILIDSPFPIGLEKLPPRLYDYFNSIGLFGTGAKAPPTWLLPHFLAFVDSLDLYRAVPYSSKNAPRTHIIWARDGVCKNASDPQPPRRADDPKEMKWLLDNRTDFGANGWDGLLGAGGEGKVVVEVMSGANHFTMMEGEKVKELAEFVRRAMA